MRVALTGATGALGGPLLAELRIRGHAVRALVRGGAGRGLQGVEVVDGGLDDADALDALVAGCDAVLHAAYADFAAGPADGRSVAEQFVQENVVGTLRLLERAAATSARQLVFVSSLAVYGDHAHEDARTRGLALDEDYPVRPREFYGAHKAALETMLHAAAHAWGLNAAAFRLGCLLARYPDPARDPLAPAIDQARRHGELRTTKGAWVVADVDAAAVLAGALGDAGVAGRVCNVFDRWLDFAALAPELGELLQRPVAAACAPAPRPDPPLRNDRARARHPHWHTAGRLRALLAEAVARADH